MRAKRWVRSPAWTGFWVVGSAAACGGSSTSIPEPSPDTTFGDAEIVHIRGYDDHAMEPFLSRDGQKLFFNNRNDPDHETDIHLATRTSGEVFEYVGPVDGVNVDGFLDGVPSMDQNGRFYWVSTRSYPTSLATLHVGDLEADRVADASLVDGNMVRRQPGWLIMDAEITADGENLYYADARFDGAPVPAESEIRLATRTGVGFDVHPDSDRILESINRSVRLTYAPSITADGLELFYTGWMGEGQPQIYVARRASVGEPFGEPARITAASGLAEGPTVSPDARTLYFHRLDGGRFTIYRAVR